MFIDNKITKRIAELAKLELTEQEIEEYSKDLSNILKWMEKLKEVDVSNIEPVTSITENNLFEREDDDKKNSIDRDELMLNAPEKIGNYFTVPKVIE